MEIQAQDFLTIGLLVFLEGILSVDNAVVLAVLAGRLPKHLQRKALTYGLVGALAMRAIALGMAKYLMQWVWIKFAGGGYLLYVAIHHWVRGEEHPDAPKKSDGHHFWRAVLVIELTDMAFAVDSILAAVAVSNKYWVVLTGGALGVILMRYAASWFILLLKKYPNFESAAYLLVFVIGSKLFVDGFKFESVNFHSAASPASWIFWASMFLSILYGFRPAKLTKARLDELKREEKAIEFLEGKENEPN